MQARSKKHLAMLVGMALSVSVGVGMNPMEAYAADIIVDYRGGTTTVPETISGYYVTVTDGHSSATQILDTASDANKYIQQVLAKEGNSFTLNASEWSDNLDKYADLVSDFRDKEITLGKNSSLDITFNNKSKYTINNGADLSNVKLVTVDEGKGNKDSYKFVVSGNLTSLDATVDGRKAQIEVAKGKTIDTVTVSEATGENSSLNFSGDGTVTILDVKENINLNSSVTIRGVNIASGKTLTSTSNLTVGYIQGDGSLEATGQDISGYASINITGDIKAASIDTHGYVSTKGSLEVSGDLKTAGAYADSIKVGGQLSANTVTADSVTLGEGASVAGLGDIGIHIMANTINLSSSLADTSKLDCLKIAGKNDYRAVKVNIITSDGSAVTEEQINAVKALAERSGVKVTISTVTETPDDGNTDDDTPKDDTTAAEKAQKAADAALEDADKALKKINEFATVEPEVVAAANPFTTKLPGASDIAAIGAPTEAQKQELRTAREALNTAMENLDTQIDAAEQAGKTELKAQLQAKRNELEAKVNSMTDAGMETKATQLRAAVQEAGKTAAAPGIASARTAAVITEVMTNNVVARTSELRTLAAAVDDGRPAPDNLWFQYKHTNMDVDRGSVYSKSTVKTNNYQLGYDTKIGENDYLGAYIGTTDGSVEFNGPAQSGNADIKNSLDFGIYGTHMLPADQYIDYMIHTGKFDSKYSGETWGTRDTGAMVGYGAKIAANERLTWNPYVQLAYDKVSVDSYKAGENNISSDKSNNWTAKLGINLMDASGLYGGLAYSRGLSGSYNAYINGVPMPTQDNKANVIYLSLGYRATLSKKVFLDVSAEKTFADYKGWTATGKVNFYF